MCKVRCWRWLFCNKIPISLNTATVGSQERRDERQCGWGVGGVGGWGEGGSEGGGGGSGLLEVAVEVVGDLEHDPREVDRVNLQKRGVIISFTGRHGVTVSSPTENGVRLLHRLERGCGQFDLL